MGIEPTYQAWKASVLPLNYARNKTALYYTKKKLPTEDSPGILEPSYAGAGTPGPLLLYGYCSKYKARRTYHCTKKAGAPITRPPVNRIGRPIPLQEAHPKTGLSWHSHTAIIKTLFKISRPNFTGRINLVIKLFADGIFFDIIVMFKIFDVYGAVAKW